MVTKPSPSCESIMPKIISFGDISINFNIDGVTLLLLMLLLVVLGTVLLKILICSSYRPESNSIATIVALSRLPKVPLGASYTSASAVLPSCPPP